MQSKPTFLTGWNFVRGVFFGVAEKVLPKSIDSNGSILNKFKLVKLLKIKNGWSKNVSTGIYAAPDNRKVIIKYLNYQWKNLDYIQLLNEANTLQNLDRIFFTRAPSMVEFPRLLEVSDRNNELVLVIELIKGRTLSCYSGKFKFEAVKKCLSTLNAISAQMDDKYYETLPKRSNFLLATTFSFYLLYAFIKDPLLTIRLWKLNVIFWKYIPSLPLLATNYVISHRDLHDKNIIITNRKVSFIDMEICVLAEKDTDLAIAVWHFWKDFGIKTTLKFLKRVLPDIERRKKFISLSTFYTVQLFAMQPKDSDVWPRAREYADIFINEIIPQLLIK